MMLFIKKFVHNGFMAHWMTILLLNRFNGEYMNEIVFEAVACLFDVWLFDVCTRSPIVWIESYVMIVYDDIFIIQDRSISCTHKYHTAWRNSKRV